MHCKLAMVSLLSLRSLSSGYRSLSILSRAARGRNNHLSSRQHPPPPTTFTRSTTSSPQLQQKRSLSAANEKHNQEHVSSARGRHAVSLLPTYLADARAVERYSLDTPDGALQLGVAEHKLMEDWLIPALNDMPELEADKIYYQPTGGRPDCVQIMCQYVEQLLKLDKGRLDPNHMVVGAGCNAVLENLCFCLANPGESVLIPTPYYAAFEFDLVARAGLKVERVMTGEGDPIDPSSYYVTTEALDHAYKVAESKGSHPRILLLSNPQNPLGVCYPPKVIQECIEWCRDRQVHLVSDEIYAGSVYGKDKFNSVLELADTAWTGLGPYVHWVYALSKDFSLSGMRVGAAYSENPEIQVPMQKLNDMCQMSSQTQAWTMHALTKKVGDKLWTQAYREENHKRIKARCDKLKACLDECGIPYLPSTAGLFLWMDFSKYLPEYADGCQERALYLELVKDYGLLFTPGLSMRNIRPGFFRCVFTAASDKEFGIALERLRRFAADKEAED